MQYHKKEALLALFFFLLAVVSLSGAFEVTGAFAGALGVKGNSVLGLFLFTTALVLFLHTDFDERKKIGGIVDDYEHGKINALEAAYLIDEAVKIREVHFKRGFEHSVSGEDQRYPVFLKDADKGLELAIAEYLLAARKNPVHRSEVHLGKEASTKHHKEGFLVLLENYKKKFQRKYSQKLQSEHHISSSDLFGI